MALNFMRSGNVLIEIDVDADASRDLSLDLGYVYLGELSKAFKKEAQFNEEEVLFNVLSSFEIKSVGK